MEQTSLPNELTGTLQHDHTSIDDNDRTQECDGTQVVLPRPVTPNRNRLEHESSFGRRRSDSNASSSSDASSVSLPIWRIGETTTITSPTSMMGGGSIDPSTVSGTLPRHEIPVEHPTSCGPPKVTTAAVKNHIRNTKKRLQVHSNIDIPPMDEFIMFTNLLTNEELDEWERQTSCLKPKALVGQHLNHSMIDDHALEGVASLPIPVTPNISYDRYRSSNSNALPSTVSTWAGTPSHQSPVQITVSCGPTAITRKKTSCNPEKPSAVQNSIDFILMEGFHGEGVTTSPSIITPDSPFGYHQDDSSSWHFDACHKSLPIRLPESPLEGTPSHDVFPLKIAARKSTKKNGDEKVVKKKYPNPKKPSQVHSNAEVVSTCTRNDVLLGPIVTYTRYDVLLGRGGLTNKHYGNVRFRAAASLLRPEYVATNSKTVKRHISERLVAMMKQDGARFLDKHKHSYDNVYFVVDDIVAINKSSQAIREDPEVARVRRQNK